MQVTPKRNEYVDCTISAQNDKKTGKIPQAIARDSQNTYYDITNSVLLKVCEERLAQFFSENKRFLSRHDGGT